MREVLVEQGTEEWLAARCGLVTASCMDRIITPAKGEYATTAAKGYAAELIAERLMGPKDAWVSDYRSNDMVRGVDCEPEARKYFELERNVDVRQVGFCVHENEWWGCSPDGLIDVDGGLELKCPTPKTQITYLDDGGLPREYAPQVHGCLIVTGRSYWEFLSYCRGLPPHLVRVEPDAFTDKLRECLKRFGDVYEEMLAKVTKGREAYIDQLIANAGPFTGPMAAFVPPVMEESYF